MTMIPPVPSISGLEALEWVPRDRIVVLGVDLDRAPGADLLRSALGGARELSLRTIGETEDDYEPAARRRLRVLRALRASPCDALIIAQPHPRLRLFALTVPARRRFVLRDGALLPLGPLAVSRDDLAHLERAAARARAQAARAVGLLGRLGPGNDYGFIEAARRALPPGWPRIFASVMVPVYNRRTVLERTLAGLARQTYPRALFEVIVADDGSSDHPEALLDRWGSQMTLRFVRQEDLGYRLAAVRNLAIQAARGEVIVSLDCDMLPRPGFLEAHLAWFHAHEGALCVIGDRRFVNADALTPDQVLADFAHVERLPAAAAPAAVRTNDDASADWRQKIIADTDRLKAHAAPYRVASGGNVAYRRADALAAGLYDEGFQRWGGEDSEFGYRLHRRGAYFIPDPEALAYHQDHPTSLVREEDHKITRALLGRKVPSCRDYVSDGHYEVPALSVYIAARDAAETIARAVDSALGQTFPDLEVCVCDDGSTDATTAVLAARYGGDPRVRWIRQERRGAGAAANAAIELCRGEFVLGLDARDELLPGAATALLEAIEASPRVALALGGHERRGSAAPRLVYPPFGDAFVHLGAPLLTPPGLFRMRDFRRTTGFDEGLAHALDLDLSLKLAEVGEVRDVRQVLSRRHRPDEPASSPARAEHLRVVRAALARRGLDWEIDPAALGAGRGVDLLPRLALALLRRAGRRLVTD